MYCVEFRRSSLRKLPKLTVPIVCKTILGLTDEQCAELECLKNVRILSIISDYLICVMIINYSSFYD
jgi:hypothetical protein